MGGGSGGREWGGGSGGRESGGRELGERTQQDQRWAAVWGFAPWIRLLTAGAGKQDDPPGSGWMVRGD